MRRLVTLLIILLQSLLVQCLLAQVALPQEPGPDSDNTGDTVCTFADGKQLTVRYNRAAADPKKDLPTGKLWSPGGAPMNVFTEAELTVGNAQLAVGAYSMFFIPGKDNWTLIINRNVATGAAYDEKQDIARVPMPVTKRPSPQESLSIYLGHSAPKRCEMRVDYGKTRIDGMEFNEK